MTPHQTTIPVFYDVLGLKITWRQSFFLMRKFVWRDILGVDNVLVVVVQKLTFRVIFLQGGCKQYMW